MGERFREARPAPVRFCLIEVSDWRPNALPLYGSRPTLLRMIIRHGREAAAPEDEKTV